MNTRCTDPAIGALLAAYELDLTSKSESERFESHVLNCEHCLARVEQFSGAADVIRHHPSLREAVGEVLQSQRPARTRRSLGNLLWPADYPWLLRPALSLGALLAAIVIALFGWLQPPGAEPVSTVVPIELSPHRSNSAASFALHSDRNGLLSFVYPGAVEGEPYEVALYRANETVFQVDTFSTFDGFGLGRLYVPGALLEPGPYVLTVRPLSEISDSTALTYRFELTRP